ARVLPRRSVFHGVAAKDAIVEALLESSIGATLAYAERVARAPQRAALRLFRGLRFDARQLCAAPDDLTAVVLSPESWVRRYERFWRRRDRLIAIVGELVAAGMEGGG